MKRAACRRKEVNHAPAWRFSGGGTPSFTPVPFHGPMVSGLTFVSPEATCLATLLDTSEARGITFLFLDHPYQTILSISSDVLNAKLAGLLSDLLKGHV